MVGDYDLSFLAEMPLPEAKAWLMELPGIGPKTAAIILCFSLGMPAMPVDTHIYRVSKRLGLIGRRISAEAAPRHPGADGWRPRTCLRSTCTSFSTGGPSARPSVPGAARASSRPVAPPGDSSNSEGSPRSKPVLSPARCLRTYVSNLDYPFAQKTRPILL